MSLYRYVADRGRLEALVVDLVLSEVDTTPPRGAGWEEQLTVLAQRVRAAVGAHPDAVPLTMAHRHRSVGVLRWAESALGVLAGAGFTGEDRAIALRVLLAHVIGSLQLEHPRPGPGTAAIAARGGFPLLAETAAHAGGVDDEFRRGLAVVPRGLRRG